MHSKKCVTGEKRERLILNKIFFPRILIKRLAGFYKVIKNMEARKKSMEIYAGYFLGRK